MTRPTFRALALAAAFTAIAATAQAEPATYQIDPTHTSVIFEAKHFGTSTNRGRFDRKSGTVSFDRASRTGRADITIETGSISTGVGPFDGHLRSADFFDSEKHPTARFVSEQFRFEGDKVARVDGQLTLRGQTHPVVLTASNFNCFQHPQLKREVCGGDFETTIQRSQWGMDYGLPGIPDQVRLLVQVEAIRQ